MQQPNFRMIALARESRGLTQTELAAKIKSLNQGNLSKIERNELNINEQTLGEIANVLSYPIDFFYQREVVVPISSFYYRKKATIKKRNMLSLEATINIIRKCIDILVANEEVQLDDFDFPKFDLNDGWTPISAAKRLREFLRLPKGPIRNPFTILEDAGIIIYELDTEEEGFDGITTFTDSGRPVIFLNKNLPNDRKRFTIGHELAHLVLHIPFVLEPFRDEENEANLFSGEFNMPESDCRGDLLRFGFSKLGPLKQYWGLSKAAIIRRARNLELINNNTYTYLQIELGRKGERKRETGVVEIDEPTLLNELLKAYVEGLGYTDEELVSLLKISKDDFLKLFRSNKAARIRILKNIV